MNYLSIIKKLHKLVISKIQNKYNTKLILKNIKNNDRVIFSFPDYSAKNPYQDLLKKSFPSNYHYLSGSIEEATNYLSANPDKQVIFHLHWPDKILANNKFDNFVRKLEKFKDQGGIILWTIHNLLPHGAIKNNKLIGKHQIISKYVNLFHFMSKSSLDDAVKMYQIPKEKCFIAMCGNYIDSYPNNVSKESSKKFLNINQEKRVIGFFGQIKDYKAPKKLIETFNALKEDNPELHLIIAGELKLNDKEMQKKLFEYSNLNTSVSLINDYIEKDLVQYYLNASDVMILPYSNITNSGIFILGLTFGCCIIAPKTGMINDIATNDVNAILYDPNDNKSMEKAILYATSLPENKVNEIKKNAKILADSLSWEKMTDITVKELEKLIPVNT